MCVNLFAIELTTGVTVSTCSEVSLPLQQLSTPAPTLMNVIPHLAQAHSHQGAPPPPMSEPFLLLHAPGACLPPSPTAVGETWFWINVLLLKPATLVFPLASPPVSEAAGH